MEQPVISSEPAVAMNEKPNNKWGPCVFCGTETEDEVNLGPLRTTKGLRAHYYCVLLSSTISQSGKDHTGIEGFTTTDIKKELRRCQHRLCYYCGKNNANLKCMVKKKRCNKYFHLPCGLRKFTGHEFFGMYKSYCHVHRHFCKIPKSVTNGLGNIDCVICLESLSKNCDVKELYTPNCCTRNAVMHLRCLKKYALQAGYYMKCPMCNNTNDFITNVMKFGVFVPMRDALWEKQRNAYEDLLGRYEQCDAEDCSCPYKNKNRHKDKSSSKPWYILTCKTCGGSGMHRHCNNYNTSYICGICKSLDKSSDEIVPAVPENRRTGKVIAFYDELESLSVSFQDGSVRVTGDEPAKEFYIRVNNICCERKPPEWFVAEQEIDAEVENESQLEHTIQELSCGMSTIEENLYLLNRQRLL